MMNPKRNKKTQTIIAVIAIVLIAAMVITPILGQLIR